MNIVFLDAYTTNHGELDWTALHSLGEVTIYDRTAPELVQERAGQAEVIITNKVILNREVLNGLPKLRFICVAATGYNNIDIDAAREKGIAVSNVVGYSTNSVAQQVFALLLALVNDVAGYSKDVHAGKWSEHLDFSYFNEPINELFGSVFGIYGFGKIGQAVARIALTFGMKVIAVHKHPVRDRMEGVEFVDWETLISESDILSLHAPLTPENTGLFNSSVFRKMKSSAYLINTSRGPVIEESDLAVALEKGEIAGAGMDVLSTEPPVAHHPLIGVQNCVITPHHAWATRQARIRLIQGIVGNIGAFQKGQSLNRIC